MKSNRGRGGEARGGEGKRGLKEKGGLLEGGAYLRGGGRGLIEDIQYGWLKKNGFF